MITDPVNKFHFMDIRLPNKDIFGCGVEQSFHVGFPFYFN